MALDSKNIGFVDGTIVKPPLGDPMRVIWERNNIIPKSRIT